MKICNFCNLKFAIDVSSSKVDIFPHQCSVPVWPFNGTINIFKVDILKKFPTRTLSRWWGYLSHLHVPVWMRNPLYGLYVKLYNCDMEEAMIEDLKQFPTFSEFFKRRLRPGARALHQDCEIVSVKLALAK